MKKVLLIGGSGGIGSTLHNELNNDFNCISVGSKECNVTNEYQVENTIKFSKPDVIVYLSVKNIDGQIHKHQHDTISNQINVNIYGLLNVLRYSTEIMRENKYGRIIYISSVLAKTPIRGTGIYSATKCFGESIMKTYSLENSKYGITANSIQLGYFNYGLTERVPQNVIESVKNNIPINRFGKSDELSSLVRLIIFNEYINGATIPLTGGL